ncbi:retention module-containing protein [Macromonas nakdongensis]|uniref:retention module-containing protein n=1 Tax=Macromonas nakdongensis TaxID=1843082 RepID=UPI000C340FC5|nr:retention module-containing protein [Macromonas nakdongensis]
MAQSATVTALSGKVLVIDAAGAPRMLAVGDTVQAGDTVRPAPGAQVQLTLDDGQPLGLSEGQAWLVGDDAPVPAPPALTDAVAAVIDVLERGGDLNELEAAAAGVGGAGGGGDGNSFVRLLRIAEGVTPLSYEYGVDGPAPIDTIEGGRAVGAQAVPVPGEPPVEPPPPPPPPPPGPDKMPDAQDDADVAYVVVTREGGGFNSDVKIAGHGPDVLDGHQDRWIASDNSFHIVHGGEGSTKPSFLMTDVARSEASADYVATPRFTAGAADTFKFTLASNADLVQDAGQDLFKAEVYQYADGNWNHVGDVTDANGDGVYTHTFAADGDYRIQFQLNDVTDGQAEATVQLDTDHYFAGPITETVDTVAASGNILGNDAYGDGAHQWAFAGGVLDADSGNVVVSGAYGTLTVEPDGDYIYQPHGSGGGTDHFEYTLTDADGDADRATLSIDVNHTVIEHDESDFDLDVQGHDDPSTLDIGDLLDVDDHSAASLNQYITFGPDDDGRAVMSISAGPDINGDGIPDYQQNITLSGVDWDDLLDYAGLDAYLGEASDLAILQKLLDDGRLSTGND